MTPERYKKAREAFHGAWQRPPGERTAFLDGICAGDPELRAMVESILASAEEPDEFMTGGTALTASLVAAAPAPDLTPHPTEIGRYRIIRLLGQGGMGAAFEAQQENPSRRVAVKTIRPGLGTPAMLRRFAHEAQILGRLRHPGIAQVYEAGVADGPVGPIPFIAMELIAGLGLDLWVQRLAPGRRARIELLAKVCDAVQHAHQHGVIHRDLKPGNILVESGGGGGGGGGSGGAVPKVLDFGVARLVGEGLGTLATDPGTLVGTLAYMSPEQVADGGPGVDARADVFALGVLLFELLTGVLPRPTEGKPIAEAARVVRDEDAVRARTIDPSLRGDLDTICAKALERDPVRRYQTAAELATDLRRYLGDEPIIARPATAMYQARKFARRHRGLVAGLAAAALTLIVGVASTLWYAVLAGRERGEARWTSYKLTISAAMDGVGREPTRTRAQLAESPPAFRNWEWRHLMARLSPPVTAVECDPQVRAGGMFAPDGMARAAVVRSGRLEVVDVATGALLASFPAMPGATGLALSGDGRVVASFDRRSGNIEIRGVAVGPHVDRTMGPDTVLAIGLSYDGSLLGAIISRRGVVVLDTVTGEQRWAYDFPVLSAGYGVVEFNRDNRQMLCSASASDVGTSIHLYDLGGSAPPRLVDEAYVGAFSPAAGADLIAASTIAGIRLRDARTLSLKSELHGQFREMSSIAFTGDGRRLVGFVQRSVISVWNVQTRELETAITAATATHLVATDAAGDRVLACSPGQVAVTPLGDCSTRVLRGHTNYVYSVAWSPDGALVASSGWDGTVRLWDAATGAERGVVQAQPVSPLAPVDGLSFSRIDGRLLVLTHNEGLLEIDPARLGNGPPPAAAPPEEATASYWKHASFGSKSTWSAGGERVSLSPDGALLATTERGDALVNNLATGALIRRIKAVEGTLFATAFSPDGKLLATGGDDRVVRLWSIRSGAATAELRGDEGVVYTIAFSPDGSRMVTGNSLGVISIWDTVRLEQVAELRGHTSYVHSLAFSPDGRTLASGSGDGTVRLWLAPEPPPNAPAR